MRSRSFIELSSCAKICSRICFCLSRPLTISSNEASGLAFSSCERMVPVCASIVSVASQQGQMIANLEVSAMGLLLAARQYNTSGQLRCLGLCGRDLTVLENDPYATIAATRGARNRHAVLLHAPMAESKFTSLLHAFRGFRYRHGYFGSGLAFARLNPKSTGQH